MCHLRLYDVGNPSGGIKRKRGSQI